MRNNKGIHSRKHLLPLTSDLVFKATYGMDNPLSKKALVLFLNLVLERADDPIVDIRYKNPFNYADSIEGKTMVMDIKVVTQKGEWIDIEMQIEHLQYFPERSIVYNAKILNEQLASGETYDKLKKTIVISIVQGKLFNQTKKFRTSFRYLECEEYFGLSELCELQFIELDKIDTQKTAIEMTPLERFGAYLRYAADESKADYIQDILDQGDEVITMTEQILNSISQDERLRELQKARDLGELFHRLEIGRARETGEADGEARGEARGRAEMCLTLAQKMKISGKATAEICELTGLSAEAVNQL